MINRCAGRCAFSWLHNGSKVDLPYQRAGETFAWSSRRYRRLALGTCARMTWGHRGMCTAEYRAPVEQERLWCARGTVDTADPDVCQPDSRPCKQHPTMGRSENRLGSQINHRRLTVVPIKYLAWAPRELRNQEINWEKRFKANGTKPLPAHFRFLDHRVHDSVIVSFFGSNVTAMEKCFYFPSRVCRNISQNILKCCFLHKRNSLRFT